MKTDLDKCIDRIISQTLKTVGPHPLPPMERYHIKINKDDREKDILLTEAALDEESMNIPDAEIYVNAHVPVFDEFTILHKHTWYELTYVHSGGMHVEAGGTSIELTGGDCMLLSPGASHIIHLTDPRSKVINILLKQELLNSAFFYMIVDNYDISEFLLPPVVRDNKGRNYQIYRNVISRSSAAADYLTHFLQEFLRPGPLSRNIVQLNLSGLFLEMARVKPNHSTYPESAESNPENSRGKKDFTLPDVYVYLRDHLCDATLKDTAQRFGYNPRYFSKLLKELSGQSFSEVLTQMRTEKAAGLLRGTDLPITDIAQMTGYNNVGFFYEIFERNYHMKPGEYRAAKSAS